MVADAAFYIFFPNEAGAALTNKAAPTAGHLTTGRVDENLRACDKAVLLSLKILGLRMRMNLLALESSLII
jgi:hypothetical protein